MAGATPQTESGICQCPTMSLSDTEVNSIWSEPPRLDAYTSVERRWNHIDGTGWVGTGYPVHMVAVERAMKVVATEAANVMAGAGERAQRHGHGYRICSHLQHRR